MSRSINAQQTVVLKVNLENKFEKNFANFKLNFDYKDNFELNLINYKKPSNSIANVFLDLEKTKDEIKINQINFKEANYLMSIYLYHLNTYFWMKIMI